MGHGEAQEMQLGTHSGREQRAKAHLYHHRCHNPQQGQEDQSQADLVKPLQNKELGPIQLLLAARWVPELVHALHLQVLDQAGAAVGEGLKAVLAVVGAHPAVPWDTQPGQVTAQAWQAKPLTHYDSRIS